MMKARRKPRQSKAKTGRPAAAYPRHGKAFATPVRLSPLGRKQVGVTPLIRNYAESFRGKGLEGTELARAIVRDIASFKANELLQAQARNLWANRSASEIIKSREVVVGLGEARIMGCTDRAQAAVAALRAAGFMAIIVRKHWHTYAKMLYKHKNRWTVFIANPSEKKRSVFRQMTSADKRDEVEKIGKDSFAEGVSLAEIGIKSYGDFEKY